MDTLRKKINNKDAVIGIIGLGYVGLPIAVLTAKKGFSTIGFDIQQERTDMVNNGKNYMGDVRDKELKEVTEKNKLWATTDYSYIQKCDVICIAVPTPLDQFKQPNTIYVENSTKDIGKYITKNTLVILESTTYPGTTEEIILPILEKESGLKIGNDIFLSYSPERIDPGNKKYNTQNTPKVIGGVTKTCTEITKLFYKNILEAGVFEVGSPSVAEMEKIFENTFRNINIGLVNEMAILCNKMGIDIWEVIEAASTKPYGFMPFYPGPGIGGHCIPIDPFYLTWKAREYDYHTRLIELSGEINNYMPEYVMERTMKILNKNKIALNDANVLLLGVSYKKDIDDLRESPALKIIDNLKKHGANIYYNDPFVDEFKHRGDYYKSSNLNDLSKYDIVIITTDHSDYNYKNIVKKAELIFDTRNATEGIKDDKIEKL
ncbi:MAG: nucleotide sugar dehydrogenase [Candidatus Mcinerneyibacterium aminivorans]|uniref:Nucleotide sugar dehydrogenase n=1 Tax=Candidatus Mcinerneyibacterium aminivorans TaxID=2703815 RepID=A0A5D0MFT4_9BACT|nr:MAG: nucleotide sugar dehydrogenase [Candidatus Mcinerneyibacterium aminivorans]